jgi:hypothetical protein
MRNISDKDKLFYFQKNFFTLDGLWMLESEKEVGWEKALRIDKNVWIKLMEIIFRRIKKYLKIEKNDLNELVEILTFRWSIEGWKYSINNSSEFEAKIEIKECPYKAIMDRNHERQEKIPLICKDMCIPFYEAVLNDFNPKIQLERSEYLGLGNNRCNFHFMQIHE